MYFIIRFVLSISLLKNKMSKSNTAEFHMSLTRIYLFFAALFQWIQSILRKQTKSIEQPKQVSPKDAYIERNKSKFLQTFQENPGTPTLHPTLHKSDDKEPPYDWNANIEPVIRDPAQMAKILTDPDNELEKHWRSRVLIENTPRGNVIMFYDIYKRGFSYYCDSAVMPYEIMNAVAMKYVLTFHCREFFIDDSVLPKKEKREDSDQADDQVPLKNPNKNVVLQDKRAFVKYKTYNTATKKAGVSPIDDKMINCFLHLGGVRNWTPIPKKAKANPLNGFQTDMMPGANNNRISYLEYKKRLVTAYK